MDNRRYPNLFWPVLLIGLGVLFMLSNLGLIEPVNINVLWQLWPVFIVLVGINILFGRNHVVSSLLSAVLAAAIVAFLIFAPQLVDILPEPDMITETYTEQRDNASSANITLDFDRGDLTINPLVENPNLFTAKVTHNERLSFNASGSSMRNIRLDLDEVGTPGFGFWLEDQRITADIGLTDDLPLDLSINVGSGEATLNLDELSLTGLEADSGSGSVNVTLPDGDYQVRMSAGSGSLGIITGENSELDLGAEVGSGRITLTLGEDSTGRVQVESGSGGITINIPADTPVQLRASTGSGSVNLPKAFIRTRGGDEIIGQDGTWQTESFESAETGLVIIVEVGSGSVRVNYE